MSISIAFACAVMSASSASEATMSLESVCVREKREERKGERERKRESN